MEQGITVLVLMLIFGVVTASVGSPKGEAILGFFVGFFFGPLGLIAECFSKGNRKPCPFCRELTNPKAAVCPHCQRDIDVSSQTNILRNNLISSSPVCPYCYADIRKLRRTSPHICRNCKNPIYQHNGQLLTRDEVMKIL